MEYIYDYSDDFVSESGGRLDGDLCSYSNGQYSNHWTLGGENYLTFEYMGASVQVPVTITENPVESISFTPANPYEIIENTMGSREDEHWIYDTPYFQVGDVLIINNKDGSTVSYTYVYDDEEDYYDYFVSENGDKLDLGYLERYTNQYSKYWTLGSDNYFTVEYMGVSTQVPVRILAGIWHKHSYTDAVTAPTCTERGYTVHTCKCGYSYTDCYVNAKGHNFGNNSQNCLTCGAVNPNYVAPQPAQPTVPVATATPKAPKGAKKVNGEWIAKKQKNTKISKLSKAKKSFKANWKKVSGITGYQIQYSTSKKFTKKTTKSVTIKKNKTTKATVKKLKAKKKYYVRIRTYKNVKLNGKTVKVYSSWSKAKTVTTK